MIINSLHFGTGGQCVLTLEEADQWLRATWTGIIGTHEAMRGAREYLTKVKPFPCDCLLNDNLAMHGPWFNSMEWLEHAWLPQAEALGLRYVAHVVQADTGHDIISLHSPHLSGGGLELQLFHDVSAAEDWLRRCRQLANMPRGHVPQLTYHG